MKKGIFVSLVFAILLNSGLAVAQNAQSGDEVEQNLCNNLAKSAASQIETRIKADNTSIPQPESVFNLSCLNGFFSGFGINVFSNVINPQNILNQITNKICAAVDQTWNSAMNSSTQCGLTLSIPDIGFNGINLGSGSLCRNVNIGNGTQIGSVTVSGSVNNSTNANPTLPSGYSSGGPGQ